MKFSCACTKCASIVTEALAPHFTKKLINNLGNPCSIMIDESNDAKDKSCIILVRVLDPEIGDIRTRFLDMPVVNKYRYSKQFVQSSKIILGKIWHRFCCFHVRYQRDEGCEVRCPKTD